MARPPRANPATEFDSETIKANFLRPAAPTPARRAAVGAAVRDADSIAGALEVLAVRGLVPEAWASAPPWDRFYAATARVGPGVEGPYYGRASVEALALDPDGVEAALRLAREARARLAPWRHGSRAAPEVRVVALEPAGIRERVEPNAGGPDPAARHAWALLWSTAASFREVYRPKAGSVEEDFYVARELLDRAWGDSSWDPRGFDALPAERLDRAARTWAVFAHHDAAMDAPSAKDLPRGAGPVPRFGRYPDPFAPMAAIYGLGYAARFATKTIELFVPVRYD